MFGRWRREEDDEQYMQQRKGVGACVGCQSFNFQYFELQYRSRFVHNTTHTSRTVERSLPVVLDEDCVLLGNDTAHACM